jgi:hypothetical protein
MDLNWKPVVLSKSLVDVPEVAVPYERCSLAEWEAAYEPWLKSKRRRTSVWGDYADLADGGRFLLPYPNERPARRFAELHVARSLTRDGFTCWGGVHLFEYQKRVDRGKGNTKANTDEVRGLAPWQWPSEIQNTLTFQPRNPDIVAWSMRRKEWRFCEVKRFRERVDPRQVKTLAVLHLHTGAPVAIAVVVEAGIKFVPRMLRAALA